MRMQSSGDCPDAPHLARLITKLSTCRETDVLGVPANIVTMNSHVRVRDLRNSREVDYVLAYPSGVDANNNRISILTPLGVALLGARIGTQVDVQTPFRLRRLYLLELLFQPEASGRFDL